jgi:hypothetical protein
LGGRSGTEKCLPEAGFRAVREENSVCPAHFADTGTLKVLLRPDVKAALAAQELEVISGAPISSPLTSRTKSRA